MPTLESNGTTLFYEVTGEGSPIIFTHGASWNHLQTLVVQQQQRNRPGTD